MNPPSTEQFVRLFAQHDRELYRYVLTLLPDETAAEDVMQEVAADLWKKFAEYDDAQPFGPWARRFAFIQVQRHRRTTARGRVLFNDALLERLAADREDEQPVLEARRRALKRCMAALAGEDRDLLRMRYHESRTVADAAARAGVPAKALYTALDRIRRGLMRCIERRLGAGGEA